MTVEPTWRLALALVLLVGLSVTASLVAHLRTTKETVVAAVRAVAQLAVVSLIVVAALQHIATALAFVALMFAIGAWTTSGRTGVRRCWPYVAAAMAAGVLPVLAVIYLTGTAPLNGLSLIPIAGIVTGNMMTAHTLVAKGSFATLRARRGEYEAALAIGLARPDAIRLVDPDSARDATIPNIDSTRTVGLVTLPGAFIGVLLGGGSPVQAGAAQVLVLVGIMAGQALTVATAHAFIERALILPDDLRQTLRA